MCFEWVFFLVDVNVLSGSPRVRTMGHACGEPNVIELTAAHGLFYCSFPGQGRGSDTARRYLASGDADRHRKQRRTAADSDATVRHARGSRCLANGAAPASKRGPACHTACANGVAG